MGPPPYRERPLFRWHGISIGVTTLPAPGQVLYRTARDAVRPCYDAPLPVSRVHAPREARATMQAPSRTSDCSPARYIAFRATVSESPRSRGIRAVTTRASAASTMMSARIHRRVMAILRYDVPYQPSGVLLMTFR